MQRDASDRSAEQNRWHLDIQIWLPLVKFHLKLQISTQFIELFYLLESSVVS